jgi:histidine ammonia-lyase
MEDPKAHGRKTTWIVAVVLASIIFFALQVPIATAYDFSSAPAFKKSGNSQSGKTITLDGKHLTIDDVVAVARFGAKVKLADEARQRSLNAYYLLLEGAREGIPIYFFNRGTGSGRQVPIFTGDPLSTDVVAGQICPITQVPCSNRDFLLQRQLQRFQAGTRSGFGPEVADEEIVRAMMVVRANNMVYEAATPQLTQMLIDLLNKNVTPVVQSRGSPGEGDLPQMTNVGATMVGSGDAYYKGKRMSAMKALQRAGLKPLQEQPAQPFAPGAPFAADDAALVSTNAFSAGQAALLLYDARHALNWADMIYAMALLGMNSSVTPIASIVQEARPFPWQNFSAARALDLISGSYLFQMDELSSTGVPTRIIQDPESLRANSQRNGAAWETWDRLNKNIFIQNNSSDHNPAVLPGTSPSDSPELNTPWFLQYFVEGGPNNSACVGAGCEHGYILSNSNWDPISWVNDIEAFTIAIASMDAAVGQVIQRFTNTFFTVIGPGATSAGGVLSTTEAANAAPRAADYTIADLTSEILSLANPVPAQGNAIVANVEDLEAEGRIKVEKARIAVDNTLALLGQELLTTTYWMNVREKQGQVLGIPRSVGSGPTAAWQAFRKVVPWQMAPADRPAVPPGQLALDFLAERSAAEFHPPLGDEPSVQAGSTGLAEARGLQPRKPLQLLGWPRPELYGYRVAG